MFLAPYNPLSGDHVSEEHAQEFERLIRAIDSAGRFRLLFAEFNQQGYRDLYIERLNAYYPSSAVLYVEREKLADASQLRARLHELAQTQRLIHIAECNIWQVAARDAWLRHLNAQRELLARDCPVVLLFWLNEELLKQLAVTAPDLWSWRSGVFNFTVYAQTEATLFPTTAPATLALTEQQRRQQRIAELTEYLQNNAVSEALRASLLLELGDLHESIGELNEAMACFQETVDLETKIYGGSNAGTQGRIADILEARGELDEALRIRQQEQLPIFEKLGDVREKAVTMGKIADILQARGELDEALRIRQQEELPVYERLGDVRSKAVTMGYIADILQARGELDEALRIRQQEELPVYQRLGDVREKAVTMGKIADILEARGELDEALQIRQQEELPVYQRLGDVRSKAVTMGKIADILEARGELDEALRIRQQEVLPNFERLGDPRLQAVEKGKIADILQARGELDEALRIRQQEQLPVYQRLGDVRELMIVQWKIALQYMEMKPPRRAEANQLLCQALRAAQQMRIPEAGQIQEWLEYFEMKC